MKNVIEQFENKLLKALEFKHKGEPQKIKTSLIETSFVTGMNIKKFMSYTWKKVSIHKKELKS